ncbi:MAG: Rrf2 family transcriptional regulator [Clostridia bacterium]|nr:Rrf2 family transcriptional regulator [Clostridia bacterium]
MKISTRGRYALRMLIDIAENQENGFVALKEISLRQDISKKYLEQIVPALSASGYLIAGRGFMGGYKLSKRPSAYTVADILRATEGSLAPVACLEGDTNLCQRADSCDTLYIWKGLMEVIENYLEKITLQDILNRKIKRNDDYVLL